MRRTRVYIAGPINGSGIQSRNVRRGLQTATALVERGYNPYIPHLTCFWEAASNVNLTHEQWISLDTEWLVLCDAVLRLEGVSAGADQEVTIANRCGIRVFYSLDTLVACEKPTKEDNVCKP